MSEQKTSWVTAKPEEVKAKILELAKQGHPAERIGLYLRDQQGIPRAKLLGIKISKILKEAGLYQESKVVNREKKTEILAKHSQKNKHDYKASRSLMRITTQVSLLNKKKK